MLGKPKYKRGNKVLFKCADKEKVGYSIAKDGTHCLIFKR